ncbi:MAG: phosphoribosylformylglycinamidine synthase subunit PurS [Chloroflexi bacterium]|nr:phosphoribosylformylglycinamidine synthase subunit PurS [Chloroflexota bacterium]
MFLAKIRVTLKPTVNDPQGKTIAQALGRLGFDSVESLRAGKYFEVELDESERAQADVKVKAMCQQLLANPVIERFEYDLEPAG